jgi:hypothetical protein
MAINTTMTTTLTMMTKTTTKMATKTVQWQQLGVVGGNRGGQRMQRQQGLSVFFIETKFWVLLVVGKVQGRQAGS